MTSMAVKFNNITLIFYLQLADLNNVALGLQMHKNSVKLQQSLYCTYGISSGSTSAKMLMESVLALEVGAAASSSFRRAI